MVKPRSDRRKGPKNVDRKDYDQAKLEHELAKLEGKLKQYRPPRTSVDNYSQYHKEYNRDNRVENRVGKAVTSSHGNFHYAR